MADGGLTDDDLRRALLMAAGSQPGSGRGSGPGRGSGHGRGRVKYPWFRSRWWAAFNLAWGLGFLALDVSWSGRLGAWWWLDWVLGVVTVGICTFTVGLVVRGRRREREDRHWRQTWGRGFSMK